MTRKGHKTSVPRNIELVAVEGKKDPEYQIFLDCIRKGDKPSDYTNGTHPPTNKFKDTVYGFTSSNTGSKGGTV